ncbi:MAG: hypothetical protein M3436_16620 [Pseudomonadota bacterium]|nr:hypothetical protein [Pseudomonadota bacterium]
MKRNPATGSSLDDFLKQDGQLQEATETALKRVLTRQQRDELRRDIQRGLDDSEAGRVRNHDPERIIQKGIRKLGGVAP